MNDSGKPIRPAFSRRMREKTEWKVPMRIWRLRLSGSICAMRSRICSAALFVKVRASMLKGATPRSIM